jgi:glutathione S-transferase
MYTVIGTPKARPLRVTWMLRELDQSYELKPVPPRDPSVMAINPSGKIPVLKDGDAHIFDSVAICQYLADKHGRHTFKAGTVERAHQDSFTQFAVDDVEGPLWTDAKHKFAIPPEYRVADVARACRFDFDRAMASLSQRLGSNDYVMGDTFTVPDVILGHLGGWAAGNGWEVPQANVKAYIERVRSRPAFKAAFAEREAL